MLSLAWIMVLLHLLIRPQFHILFSPNTSKGLFTPWTMKSSQDLVTYVIGCLTHPRTTLVYTKEEMVKVTMKFEVPERHIKVCIIHWHGATGFAEGEAKEVLQ
jgi:hypothetical protein